MTFNAYLPALLSSAQAWEDTSDQVRGTRKSLADIDTGLLGDRVSTHAESFIDTWMVETKRLETDATDHGEALRESTALFAHSDGDALARNQQLLSWTDRDATPIGFQR